MRNKELQHSTCISDVQQSLEYLKHLEGKRDYSSTVWTVEAERLRPLQYTEDEREEDNRETKSCSTAPTFLMFNNL